MSGMKSIYDVHDFAVKWAEKFQNPSTLRNEISKGFAEECVDLGFRINSGKPFLKAYHNPQAFSDYTQLNRIIDQVDDFMLLGSTIYSKWRFITHWSDGEDLLSPENRQWFIIALSRLAYLSSNEHYCSVVFVGQVQKIRIISNNIGFGQNPDPGQEVEQHLTITANGGVWFSAYNYLGANEKYKRGRAERFTIPQEKTDRIFTAFKRYSSRIMEFFLDPDAGEWDLIMTDTAGREFTFSGMLCSDFEIDGINLSEMIRDALGIKNLFVFDGDNKPDKVERISIEYHRIKKINTKDRSGETQDYMEQLVIDRQSDTVEYIQKIGPGCNIIRKYQVGETVSGFLNRLNAEALFQETEGTPSSAENPSKNNDYTITVDFRKKPQLVIKGPFNKEGLPKDWPEFASKIDDFVRYYSFGDILNPSVYSKGKRQPGDYIFCSVKFTEDGKTYYYISDDETIKVGDIVVVPVGTDEHHAAAEVIDIEYFSEEKAPFPIDKAKHIIGRG